MFRSASALRRRFVQLCALTLALATFSQTAVAQDSPHTLTYKNLVAARLNPLGLVDALSVDYAYRLYESESPLFKNNYVSVGVMPIFSPAYIRGGVGAAVQPLSILRLGVGYEWVNYFGNFDFLQSYDNRIDIDYSDSGIDEGTDNAYSTSGTQLSFTGLLQMKVGPIAARSNFKLFKVDMDLKDGDLYWFDIQTDMLLSQDGWGWTNDADVLYITDFGFIAGIRYNVSQALFEGEVADDPNVPIHRIGPLLSYEISSNPGETVDTISTFALVNWYLQHRFRTGEDTSQAMPYIAIGMTVTGNLL